MPQTHSSQDVAFSQAPILQVSGLDKQVPFAERQLAILSDINLAIGAGESVAIVGASGSGKSTLLRCINGLETCQSGRIEVAADTEHRQPVVTETLDALVGLAAQHRDQVAGTEALAGAIDG